MSVYEVKNPVNLVLTSSCDNPNPSNALSKCTSSMGILRCSENVKWRNKRGDPKVKVSISSDAAANTILALASAAHCASASHGAYTSCQSW